MACELFMCPVCDWPRLDQDPKLLLYNICEQCGTEFGVERPDDYPNIRAAWEAVGKPFWLKTGNWWMGDLRDQQETITGLERRLAESQVLLERERAYRVTALKDAWSAADAKLAESQAEVERLKDEMHVLELDQKEFTIHFRRLMACDTRIAQLLQENTQLRAALKGGTG